MDTNGTGHKPRPQLSEVEREVLALLPQCSPAFLGCLQVEGIRRVQMELRNVRPTGDVGSNAVQRGE